MRSFKSRLSILLRYALPLVVIILVVIVKWIGDELQGGANTSRNSTCDERPIVNAVEFQDKSERKRNREHPKGDFPIYKLPEKLRRIVSDFEDRSAFMLSPFGFTHEEHKAAKDNCCEEIIDGLSATEVVALMEFYRHPKNQKLEIRGNELVGPLLYERWGKVDSEGAVLWIESKLESNLTNSPVQVDLDDPVAMDPGCCDIAHVFAGWARVDAVAALSRWESIYANLRGRGALLNLTNFDKRVRSAIYEVSQGNSERIQETQQVAPPDGDKPPK